MTLTDNAGNALSSDVEAHIKIVQGSSTSFLQATKTGVSFNQTIRFLITTNFIKDLDSVFGQTLNQYLPLQVIQHGTCSDFIPVVKNETEFFKDDAVNTYWDVNFYPKLMFQWNYTATTPHTVYAAPYVEYELFLKQGNNSLDTTTDLLDPSDRLYLVDYSWSFQQKI